MEKVVIVSGARSPIGSFGGCLKGLTTYEMGALVLNEAVRKAEIDPATVDEVIMGQAYQNGESVNIARVSLLEAGWPVTINGSTVDTRCLSGLESICNAGIKITAGFANTIAAGGVESMSRAEFYIPGEYIRWGMNGGKDPKWGFMPKGHGSLSMWGLPFFDRIQRARVMSQPIGRFGELNSMMSWAEAAAREENITREEADHWSLRSHEKAIAAIDSGLFKEEIVPVMTYHLKGDPVIIDTDEPPRRGVTIEKLSKLKTVYPDGICTAGNSSTENDGAAAVIVMSKDKAEKRGLNYLAELISFGVAADDPTLTYPAVPAAVQKALDRANLSISDIDLIEIQEAFAAQTLADAKLMGLSASQMENTVNVNGSGISLGHPIGATGTVRTLTLLNEMKRRNVRYGLVTICGGGGQGIAAIFKRESGGAL